MGKELLAEIAEAQLGLEEQPRGSNRGPALQKFFQADDYQPESKQSAVSSQKGDSNSSLPDEGYPWCASFVSWCVQEFIRRLQPTAYSLQPPRLAAVSAFPDWARENNCLISKPWTAGWPARGDVVVFNFSHCGIVAVVTGKVFSSVEGNTRGQESEARSQNPEDREGYLVASKMRNFSQVSRFIRLPQPTAYSLQPSLL